MQDHIPVDLGHATLRLGMSASLGAGIYLRYSKYIEHLCPRSLFVSSQRLSREISDIGDLFFFLVLDILPAPNWVYRHFQ